VTTGGTAGAGAAGRAAPQMDRYHSSGCRITWTDVHSGRARSNVAARNWDLTLTFGLEFYPSLRRDANWFEAHFLLKSLGGGWIHDEVWTVPINQLPGGTSGSIWLSMWWPSSGWALDWNTGPFLWRPHVAFQLPQLISESSPFSPPPFGVSRAFIYEFAVAEEDHYIWR